MIYIFNSGIHRSNFQKENNKPFEKYLHLPNIHSLYYQTIYTNNYTKSVYWMETKMGEIVKRFI